MWMLWKMGALHFVLNITNGVTNDAHVSEICEGCRILYVQDVQERGMVMTMEMTRVSGW